MLSGCALRQDDDAAGKGDGQEQEEYRSRRQSAAQDPVIRSELRLPT